MSQLIVSVGTIEKFRRFMAGTSDWDTEASVIEAIEGKFKGNEKTNIGKAFHSIIEKYGRDELLLPELVDPETSVTFTAEQAQVALDYRKREPAEREVPSSKVYQARNLEFKVTCRTDALQGFLVRDVKVIFKEFDHKVYKYFENSSQWKFYLDIFEAAAFYYDVFEVKGFSGLYNNRLGNAQIIAHDPFNFLPFDTMQEELYDLVKFFGDWVELRNLTHLFKIAQ